jgi:hypothetical protein
MNKKDVDNQLDRVINEYFENSNYLLDYFSDTGYAIGISLMEYKIEDAILSKIDIYNVDVEASLDIDDSVYNYESKNKNLTLSQRFALIKMSKSSLTITFKWRNLIINHKFYKIYNLPSLPNKSEYSLDIDKVCNISSDL